MISKDQFDAHVSSDLADKKYDVCVQFKNGDRTFHVNEHTTDTLDIWLNDLYHRVKGRIAIAAELKKGSVVYTLSKVPIFTVFEYTRCHWPATNRRSGRAVRRMLRKKCTLANKLARIAWALTAIAWQQTYAA